MKTAPPAWAMSVESAGGIHPNPAEPIPSRIPAAGRTDTGSINERPIFCSTAKLPVSMAIDSGKSGTSAQLASISRTCAALAAESARAARARHDAALNERTPALMVGTDRNADAQLVHAKSDEDWKRFHFTGEATADANPASVRVRCPRRCGR